MKSSTCPDSSGGPAETLVAVLREEPTEAAELVPDLPEGLDAVIANPPYLPTAVLASLPPEVSRFEPRDALDGGGDGMTGTLAVIPARGGSRRVPG